MKRFAPVLVVLAACGSARDENVEASEELALTARVTGAYAVPVEPALADAATSPVAVKLKALTNGTYRLQYDLPTVLTGPGQRVDLVGARTSEGTIELSGPAGTASCTTEAAQIRCVERLQGVVVDTGAVAAALDAAAVSERERAARLAVAERFSVDPLGVLTVDGAWPERPRRRDR